ncbi:MAG: hypothetical protein ACK4F3_16090, partial [Parvibaculum sp.]
KDSWFEAMFHRLDAGYLIPHYNMSNRALFRGIFDGRYKFARYFGLGEHHTPKDWETLIAHNDLELYDTQSDPDEIVNLAHEPEDHRAVIERLNAKMNDAIAIEVGIDDGSEFPGPTSLWKL